MDPLLLANGEGDGILGLLIIGGIIAFCCMVADANKKPKSWEIDHRGKTTVTPKR